jgi:predicted DNA-binding transcriptional regulator YafY
MPVRGQRLARLLKLIALLRGPSAWNARRLAEHFGTSRRNVHRDMLVLKMAGIPVYRDTEFGDGGSYRIRQDWYFPHVGLTDQECLDMSVLTLAAESKSIPLLQGMTEVRDKLLSTLPARQQDLIRDASELFEVLSLGMADHEHCSKIMLTLQQALLTKRQVEGLYSTPHERRSKRVQLQPLRVFLARNAWYVAAQDNAKQIKLFRLARFKELSVSGKPNPSRRDWSLKQMLGNAWTVYRGERDWHVEIVFDPEAAVLVQEVRWHPTQELTTLDNGCLRFRAIVSGLEEIRFWVLSWGHHATVIKPSELRHEVCQIASKLLANYSDPTRRTVEAS